MRNHKMVNVKELLENSPLTKIMEKGLALSALNQQLQELLPAEFAGQFRVANWQGQQLVIEVASAVIRQGFLFRQVSLLQCINQVYPEINHLQIRINPSFLPS